MNNSVPLTEVGTQVTIEKVPARAPVFKSLVNTTSWRLSIISFTHVRVAKPSSPIGCLILSSKTKRFLITVDPELLTYSCEVRQFVEWILYSARSARCCLQCSTMFSLVAVFSARFDACSFSSNCGNNMYHFLIRATLIVSHAML